MSPNQAPELPKTTGYENRVTLLSSYCGSLDGMRVMEAGAAAIPDLLTEVDRRFALKEAVGINKAILEARYFSPTLRVENGDLRSIAYRDRYFDLVISSSVFEHVHNFDVALAEMYRVLKPGGYLYSTFGPIWSASFGHHLWYWDGTKHITYHTLQLPPYCHLLMTQADLREWLERRNQESAAGIAEYVFTSSDQNQLMFSNYERIVADSQFESVFLWGIQGGPYGGLVTADALSELNRRYPADRNRFLYDGIDILLRRPFGT